MVFLCVSFAGQSEKGANVTQPDDETSFGGDDNDSEAKELKGKSTHIEKRPLPLFRIKR